MKKVSKGFTLVELIVVCALMGIVMAGAMALLNPTSRIANKIKSQNDEESIAIYVARYMSRELTYATKVQIVGADASDPVPAASSDYTAVYVVDNTSTRAASKKGCKGEVIRGQWAGGSITNQFVVGQEVLYGEEDFDIVLSEYSESVGQAFMTLDFAAFPMTARNGSYVRDTDRTYRYKESVEFLNINSQNGNMPKPVNADQFSVSIDPNVSTKTDKLYIFFCPAIDTVFASSAYSSSSYSSAPSSTTLSPSSTSVTPSSVTPSPSPSPAKTYTVVYMNKSNSFTIQNVPEGANLGSYIPMEAAHYPVTEDADKYFSDGWYYGPNGTGEMIGAADDSHATMGNITVYKNWVKGVHVVFKDFAGNVMSDTYVAQGSAASNPDVLPTPSDSKLIFDKFVKEGTTEEIGQALTGTEVVYVPTSRTKPADSADVVIHYCVPFKGSITLDTRNNSFIWNNASQSGTWYSNYDNMTRAKGQMDTFAELKEGASVKLAGNDSYKVTVKASDYGKTLDYYYYYTTLGDLVFSTTPYTEHKQNVTLHFIDSPNSMIIAPWNGKRGYVVDENGAEYNLTGENTMWQGGCTGEKKMTIYTYTNFTVADNRATKALQAADGSSDLYIFKNLNGDFQISDTQPPTITTLTVSFLDAPANNKISATATGTVYVPSENKEYTLNGNTQDFFANDCGAGSSHSFKVTQQTTFSVDGKGYILGNYGGSYKVWYYNGTWYNTKAEADEAYAADHNGASSFTGAINIHFSKSKVGTYNYGEADMGWFSNLIGTNAAWAATSDSKTVMVNKGETLQISIASTWSATKASVSYTYDQLASAGVTDIWIMEGKITTERPDNWAD